MGVGGGGEEGTRAVLTWTAIPHLAVCAHLNKLPLIPTSFSFGFAQQLNYSTSMLS